MAELSALRVAKQALDEQLITQQDFECVKVAFLRAQQIKAGLDAGFIKLESYEKAQDAYLHALDFQMMGAVPSISAAPAHAAAPYAAAGAAAGGAPAAGAPAAAPAAPAARQPAAAAAYTGATAAAAAPAAAICFAGAGRHAAIGSLQQQARTSGSGNASPRASGGPAAAAAANGSTLAPSVPSSGSLSGQASLSDDGSGPDIPADLPDYCKGATQGKKSMSGIGIDAVCVNLFMHLKTRSSYKWLIFKVDRSGTKVVPDKIGGQGSSYNDFICALPDNECRYAVYDYEYRSPERGTFKKLVFLLWAPDSCGTRPKMMYASTKDFFKGFLDGIGAELQANEPSELSEDEMRERVESTMTRK